MARDAPQAPSTTRAGAIQPLIRALYPGQARMTSIVCAGVTQIAAAWGRVGDGAAASP